MKVLRVIASMDPSSGGPCQGIRNIIPELEKLGVQNEVVSLDDPAAGFLGKDTFPIHSIGAGIGPWCYNPNLIPWLLHHFKRFDAVIVHGIWLYHSYAVSKALKIYSRQQLSNNRKGSCPKLFIMPHGMLDPYFQRAAGRRLKAFRNWIYWKLLEHKVINEATGILFTCEAELLLARQPFRPYHPNREINVGYGISAPPPDSANLHKAFFEKCPEVESQSYILFLSRIHQKKGVDLLIKAYEKIISKITKVNGEVAVAGMTTDENDQMEPRGYELPRLVIAGPGMETAYGLSLQKLVSKSEVLQSSVFFPGMLSGDAKWGAFYGCEAFILPSHQENFGIAVAEALACSKPVLISNQVNICSEIEAAGAGRVADDTLGGARELLENFLMLTEKDREIMAESARVLYQSRFSASSIAKQLQLVLV